MRLLSLVIALLLASCAGRDAPRSLAVTQDCQGTCTSTITIAPVVDPVLTIPVSGLPGGL